MENSIGSLIIRKLIATFVTTALFSTLFSVDYVLISSEGGFARESNQGTTFIMWFIVYAMYMGLIVITYGNLVSVAMEHLQNKWFPQHDWLYVIILGVFGLANGVLFQNGTAALLGMVAAIVYGVIDKWQYKRNIRGKSNRLFLLVPLMALFIGWAVLQLISPPLPPFTEEDAVQFATSGEGSVIDEFPGYNETWQGTINGYQVTRKTTAQKIGKEVYMVTFTEQWEKGSQTGDWSISYRVDRNSMTAKGTTGEFPPERFY